MSKTKAAGSAKNLKDSPGQRLGVKVYAGQDIKAGGIVVRQRGMGKVPGDGTKLGRDFTIYAIRDGKVKFTKVKKTRFSGHRVPRTVISIE